MESEKRRDFLLRTAKGVAGVTLGGAALSVWPTGRVLGANERVQLALIGCGGRGSYLARFMIEQGAEIVTLCDLKESEMRQVSSFLSDLQKKKPRFQKRAERVLEDKEIDAVIVATPDHWHAPMAILACQAGKDVYVEKPNAHNIWESRKTVEAAEKYDRIVQVGTQNRSGAYNLKALEYVKSGKLGDIRLVKVYNLKPGGPFSAGKPRAPETGFDWDTWLGPAPKRDYYPSIWNGGWHHYWDYSGGDLADDAAHQVDLALMLMGDPGAPKAVSSTGGRLQYKNDDSEVPDLLVSSFEFDEFVMTLEHSNYPRYMEKTTGTIRRNDDFPYWTQNATRIELYGSELLMTVGRHGGGWQVAMSGGRVVEQRYGRPCDGEHVENFLDCVKSRQRPNGDIRTIHPSCCLLHLANIAHRVGNKTVWFDPANERCVDDKEANALIRREYRKQFEVPDKI